MVHVSGFGQDGDPDTYKRASYDVIGQAFSGSMSMNGEPDGPPMKSNPFANDYVTALFALWSALAAYISAQRTGRGQVVDVAQYECQFKLLACGLMDYLMLGQEHPRTGNDDPSGLQPYGVYPTAEGYLSIGAIGGPFLRLKEVVPGLDQDRLRTVVDQIVHAAEIRRLVVAWLADRTADEAEQVAQRPRHPVQQGDDGARTSPATRTTGPGTCSSSGTTTSGARSGARRRPEVLRHPVGGVAGAPARGKDTDDVLAWLGFDADRIAGTAGGRRRGLNARVTLSARTQSGAGPCRLPECGYDGCTDRDQVRWARSAPTTSDRRMASSPQAIRAWR